MDMASNAIFFGWKRSVPGREQVTLEHFQQYVGWLNELKAKGTIADWQLSFLRPHGGDLGGFLMIHGDTQKLHGLAESPEWIEHLTRGMHHLEGSGYVFADTGAEAFKRMETWTKTLPTK
jgi:hypothetical protein